ncbi:RNA polymerase sigma factor [Terriglobus tenax]|uniref:RNA polymerase sigma factor n=1 Tax=Terriglobus tenax TaxID=1111115 RepID=UPI0021DF4A9C|nr:sigma-70 family RNA polymerase sigma factor [Terriglobus tenax]
MNALQSGSAGKESSDGHDSLWKYIFRYAYQLVGDHARAEDLTQETFVAYLRQERETPRVEFAGGWMRTVVRRLAYREYRRRSDNREVSIEAARVDGQWNRVEPVDPSPSVEQTLLDESMLKAGARLLAQLDVKERRCLTLYFRGEDFVRIAEELHISRWTARRVTLRAIEKLQHQVGATK